MRIYLTYCCAKKDASFKDSEREVPPGLLYTATPTQRFMSKCKQKGVRWAVFSDLYGVWFPEVTHRWYEKDPGKVTESEFRNLLADFDAKLSQYDEVWFYYNPGRFHPLYRRLLSESSLTRRVVRFTHIGEIV